MTSKILFGGTKLCILAVTLESFPILAGPLLIHWVPVLLLWVGFDVTLSKLATDTRRSAFLVLTTFSVVQCFLMKRRGSLLLQVNEH